MTPASINGKRFRRAVTLIRSLLDRRGRAYFEAETEARRQLKAWGIQADTQDGGNASIHSLTTSKD
jgi:hypothetical protein